MTSELLLQAAGENKEILFSLLQKMLETSDDMMFVKDLNLTYVAGTQSFAEMTGKPSMAEVLGRRDDEIFEDKELAKRYTADDRKLLQRGKDLVDYVEPLTDKDDEARYSSTSKYILRDTSGNAIGILGISRDITKQVNANQKYQQVVSNLFNLPEDTLAAILIDVTDWRILSRCHQECIDSVVPKFDSLEEFLEMVRNGICRKESEAYQVYSQFSQEYLLNLFEQGKTTFDIEYERYFCEGIQQWVLDEWTFLTNPENGNLTAVLLAKDIDSRKRAEEELKQAAQTDPLTGFLNWGAVKTTMDAYLEDEGAAGKHAAFVINLDEFKEVNDTFGREAGDLLLNDIAETVKACFGENDIIGRTSGVEFFVLAQNISGKKAAMGRARMVLDALRKVYASSTTAIGFVSVGISMYPEDGTTAETLHKKSVEALYKTKMLGENQAAFFSAEIAAEWSANALDKRYEAYNSKVVEHSNSVCYISDFETYELLHLTKAAMKLYGMTSPEEYRGKKCYEVIMGLDHPCPFCTNSRLTEGMEYRWEFYTENIKKWFDRTSSLIWLDGRPCHLEIGLDITSRKEELDLLSDHLTMEDILFQCLHTLSSEKETDAAFNRFLQAIGSFYQANRAYIFEFDLHHQCLSNTFEWCAPGVTAEIDVLQQLPLELVDDWIHKFRTEGEFAISSLDRDVPPDSEEYRILEMQGIRSLMAAPLWRDGEIIGFIGVDDPMQNQGNLTLLHSVSEFVQAELEQRRLTEDLAKALEQANIANQSKTAFLFNMSHDIRTPMNAILGFSMMAEKHIDEKERVLDCLAKLDSAGKHLLRLINDVLDMSRIESGKMAFDLQPHHVPTILRDTQEIFRQEMQKKDLTFTVSWEMENEFLLLDRLRMDQVELNLISNALKYTPEGGHVDYSIRQLCKAVDGKATYEISVKDTGIGMSEEFVARVFEPFEREQTSTVNGIQGTGLGLSIVKSLVEQMGGTITCRSQQGVGTEFIVTLTFETVSEEAMPKKAEELTPKSSFTNKRILLVEDNELNREIAVEILEEFGFIMESAEDGDIAVDLVKQSAPGHYDLILMDVQMPRMDGYTATRAIRALEDPVLANIPIVAMTANAFAEDRQNAMAAGMNEHIAKPVDVPKLMEILQGIL